MSSKQGSRCSGDSNYVWDWLQANDGTSVHDSNRAQGVSKEIHSGISKPASATSIHTARRSVSVFNSQRPLAHSSAVPDRIQHSSLSAMNHNALHENTRERMAQCSLRSPSTRQLAARQAISRDLPPFSGIPEEWPLFLSTFNSTTAMCGFTDEENTIRLQKCLKGKAYEAVKCRLMHPSNVRGVIATLKMLFGQPEAIVHSLIIRIDALPPMREDKFDTIIDFAICVQNFCATVDACGLNEHLYNVTLLHKLVNRLPPSIKLDWARHRQGLASINLSSFANWIYSLAEAASAITIPTTTLESRNHRHEGRSTKNENVFIHAHSESSLESQTSVTANIESKNKSLTNKVCPICKNSCTAVAKCKRFQELSRDSRWASVKEFGLCRRCLQRHMGPCKAKLCGKNGCKIGHHELLHNDRSSNLTTTNVSQPTGTNVIPGPIEQSHSCNTHRTDSSTVLLRYLPVILHGKDRAISTWAFFDDGSELTLLDQQLADDLALVGVTQPLCLQWTGGAKRNEKYSRLISLDVESVRNGAKRYRLSGVRTVQELLLPLQTLNMQQLTEAYPHLRGLPIESYQNIRPRILIGMKHAGVSVVQKTREKGLDDPIAVKTKLGWTVCGNWRTNNLESACYTVSVHHTGEELDESLHQTMKAYFALDSLGVSRSANAFASTENQRAQHLLQTLTTFQGDRYETGLLWRYQDVRLPDNRLMALRRHHCLRKRLEKDRALAQILDKKIADYVAKGYARKLTKDELGQTFFRTWYLPVFPVTNPNKPEKVRMVWDAAAKVFDVSLNSALLKGPDQLQSLLSILLQFREHRIGLTGDIREMFHQVRIRKIDQQCQRFFWNGVNGEPEVYLMQVMTFGACCSPSCAQYILNINAERFRSEHPNAVEVITKHHYVDDMLVSVDSENEAIQLAKGVKFIHAKGGFEIRNWMSNSKTVLMALQDEFTVEKDLNLESVLTTEKVLGMWWHTASDTFTYKISWSRFDRALLEGRNPPTKRETLCVLMTIFDPLGLIAHFLIFLKILLQEIWRTGVGWDDHINVECFKKWQFWLKVLPKVELIRVPRCYSLDSAPGDSTDTQLHTFVDASENGMAAVTFLRFVCEGAIRCSIVAAKTRVAPLKFVSIPKLELQAAVVGARLAQTVGDAISIPINRRIFWSDSRDVLCWINSDHRRYTQFVAFRVGEILEISEANEWRWVPTKLNVADDGTKWTGQPDLSSESRWFVGPEFLWHLETEWPISPTAHGQTQTELRPHLLFHQKVPDPLVCVTDFSSWRRLINVIAMVERFIANCRLKLLNKQINTEPLSMEELSAAEMYLYRLVQGEVYSDEISILSHSNSPLNKAKGSLPKESLLYQLSPYLDDRGVLRMRSRISACPFATDDAKRPIILPHDHHITRLIIFHYHLEYHHQNHETVINELRQKYHISRIRVGFAKVRRSCQRCKNETAIPRAPAMADLPEFRLAAFSLPFTHIGIDYFGPMEVVVGRHMEKRWGVLITCLTTRAIHLEVAHSLSTDSCILALRNFMARRGTPKSIHSDRGTNFIGASREMKQIETTINQEAIMKEFVSPQTSWVFNPPSAPHMGGSWERLIRTVKTNLMALRPGRKPTDEVLRNMLTEIECTVNSRPLTHVPIDDDSAPALTPNHFLLGSSNGTKPLITLDDSNAALRQNWRASQILANIFWKRWVTDYLPELTRKTKWHEYTKPIAIGDIAVIVDPKLPRNCWPKGKVIQVCVSRDNQIRSATVRTANGLFERPSTKLAVLDVRHEDK